MKISTTSIEGLLLIEPQIFTDSRGFFFESYSKVKFTEAGIDIDFVQDNQSVSCKNSVRGLHGQAGPYAQAKLVRVVKGRVLDVAVDIRSNSPTYGKHEIFELSADNKLQLLIPHGFLHGFIALEDDTIFTYKVDNYYSKDCEIGVKWNDHILGINWGITEAEALVSPKDAVLPEFRDFKSPF